MSTKINKHTYEQELNEDLSVLRKHLPDCLECKHIECVLKSSIDRYYPDYQALKIADRLIQKLHEHVGNIIAGSDIVDEHDKTILDSCLEYLQLRKLHIE